MDGYVIYQLFVLKHQVSKLLLYFMQRFLTLVTLLDQIFGFVGSLVYSSIHSFNILFFVYIVNPCDLNLRMSRFY